MIQSPGSLLVRSVNLLLMEQNQKFGLKPLINLEIMLKSNRALKLKLISLMLFLQLFQALVQQLVVRLTQLI